MIAELKKQQNNTISKLFAVLFLLLLDIERVKRYKNRVNVCDLDTEWGMENVWSRKNTNKSIYFVLQTELCVYNQ